MPLYTFVDNAVPSSSTLNSNLRDQVVTQCTSGTRPSTPVEGQYIYETDTDRTLVYNGSAWVIMAEPRQTWSPTITQGAAVAGTVTRGWFRRSNGFFEARLRWIATAAGTAGNAVVVSSPLTLADLNDGGGSFNMLDAGTTIYAGYTESINTTQFQLSVSGNFGYLGLAPVYTIAANDVLKLTIFGTY